MTSCTAAAVAGALSRVPEGGSGVIRFRCDGVIPIPVEGTLNVTGARSVTIDARGRDVAFDGRGEALPFFVAPGSTLSLRHLAIRNGSSAPLPVGGAIYNRGSLQVDDVLFENNFGFDGGGAISTLGAGAVTISRSAFVGNQSTCRDQAAGGGAVSHASSGPLTITDSTFTDNVAVGLGSGGAVYLRPDTGQGPVGAAVIRSSTFSGNVSRVEPQYLLFGTGGGAISSHGRPLTVDRSTFTGNTSNYRAGAILHDRETFVPGIGLVDRGPGGSLTVTRTTFTANTATGVPVAADHVEPGGGGAMVVRGPDAFVIERSTFRDNAASRAGVLATLSPGAITRAVFESNRGTDASLTQQSDALLGLGEPAAVSISRTVLRDHAVACTAEFGASFVDAGGNVEEPGGTCGFARARQARR